MPRIKISSNISEHGLMRPFAQTRTRLWASVAGSTIATMGLGLWGADFVINRSDSVVLNLLLITAIMMMMIVAAYLQAILVGDLFFPGPWREQIILGRIPDEDITVKDHNAEFVVLFLIALALGTYSLNAAAGDFLDFYHDEAFFAVRLRSNNPKERLAAFEDLRDPMNYKIWERPGVRNLVREHLDDPDPDVRRAAIWCAARLKLDDTRRTIEAIVLDPALSAQVRGEASQALGRMGSSESSRKTLIQTLDDSDPAVQIGALRGLALLKSPLVAEAVRPLTESPTQDIRIHAYWVLRQIEDQKFKPQLFERLESDNVDDAERCALMDTLKMLATIEDVLWARKLYKRTPKGTRCIPVIWEDRDESQQYVVYSDSHRVKLLKIVANADAKNNIEWIRRLVMDPQEEPYVREVGNEVLRRIEGTGF